jgi:hypothetical protein
LADAVQLVTKAEQEFDRAEEHRATAKAELQAAAAAALAIAQQTINEARAVTIDQNKRRRRKHNEMTARIMTNASRIIADLPPDDENNAALIRDFQTIWGVGSVMNILNPTEGTGVLFGTELTPSLSTALDYARVTYRLIQLKIWKSELRQEGKFMGDETAGYFAVAAKAKDKGLSVAELDEAIEDKLAAKAAARETTAGAKKPAQPDWIEAHKRGVAVPDFIAETFKVELAEGTMHKGLFSRYENLRRDFYGYKRSNELPTWLEAIPTQDEWEKAHPQPVAIPPRPVASDEGKRYSREMRRHQWAARKARTQAM